MPSAKQQPSNIKHDVGIIRPNVCKLTFGPQVLPNIHSAVCKLVSHNLVNTNLLVNVHQSLQHILIYKHTNYSNELRKGFFEFLYVICLYVICYNYLYVICSITDHCAGLWNSISLNT